MPRVACLVAAAVALAGCATVAPPSDRPAAALPPRAAAPPAPVPATDEGEDATAESDLPETAADTRAPRAERGSARTDLGARLAERARSFLGRRGPFTIAGERYNADCSGFVQAVYAAEGIDLRALMRETAPRERRGVKAAWLAARARGGALGAAARPRPGDLVFWHDTYDRNRNRKADDRLTHLGIVESVEDGTVSFLHRGGKGVARGVMTLARPHEASGPDGRRVNSVLRARSHPVRRGGLAGQLFAGYGRIAGGSAAVAERPVAKKATRAARVAPGERAAPPRRKAAAPAKPPAGETAPKATARAPQPSP